MIRLLLLFWTTSMLQLFWPLDNNKERFESFGKDALYITDIIIIYDCISIQWNFYRLISDMLIWQSVALALWVWLLKVFPLKMDSFTAWDVRLRNHKRTLININLVPTETTRKELCVMERYRLIQFYSWPWHSDVTADSIWGQEF